MNTVSINNAIVKELGLEKSKIVKGYAQVCNRSGICYAYRRTYNYSGDFHCMKVYNNQYRVEFDRRGISSEKKESVIQLLNKLGCKNIVNENSYIRFDIEK